MSRKLRRDDPGYMTVYMRRRRAAKRADAEPVTSNRHGYTAEQWEIRNAHVSGFMWPERAHSEWKPPAPDPAPEPPRNRGFYTARHNFIDPDLLSC